MPPDRAWLHGMWKKKNSRGIGLIHICLYPCLCVHGTAETLDGVSELPDTQAAQQTDMKETYCSLFYRVFHG